MIKLRSKLIELIDAVKASSAKKKLRTDLLPISARKVPGYLLELLIHNSDSQLYVSVSSDVDTIANEKLIRLNLSEHLEQFELIPSNTSDYSVELDYILTAEFQTFQPKVFLEIHDNNNLPDICHVDVNVSHITENKLNKADIFIEAFYIAVNNAKLPALH